MARIQNRDFPKKVKHGKGKKELEYEFDCIGGTGEPIYKRKGKEGQAEHVILIVKEH